MNQRETDGIRALTRGELDRVSGGELPSVRAGLEWVATRLGLDQRFLGSNHIRRPRPVCRTTCG